MAFLDSILELWDGQALTTTEESRTNGNILDLEASGRVDNMLGEVWLNINVSVAAGGMASGGYFQLVTSDSATFVTGTGGEQAIAVVGSAADPLFAAQLTAGVKFSVAVPLRILHRYVEIEFVAVSEAATGLTVDAWLGKEPISQSLVTQLEPN